MFCKCNFNDCKKMYTSLNKIVLYIFIFNVLYTVSHLEATKIYHNKVLNRLNKVNK